MMNNKRGGFGAKLLLVLILMIASAIGGGYAYRVLDGKMAANDAEKYIDSIKISDYDTEEAVQIETYKEEAEKSLESAQTRKEVYEILDEYKENTGSLMTKTEKELEEARKAVQDANKSSNMGGNGTVTGDQTGNETGENGILGNLFGNKSSDADDSTDNTGQGTTGTDASGSGTAGTGSTQGTGSTDSTDTDNGNGSIFD